ncbi:Phakinin [Saguinus oedipus]|uniref:Phakinin n=1 Tax=Saguinus oedipus TaxID=9490 RepID=A0ABQ9TZU6_SAGOE|nr:Phakinin [Saguinus oedipus]
MSERRVVVDLPTSASSSMPLQRRRASFRGPRSSSSLDSPPASRTNAMSGLVRSPGVYVGTAPSGCIGGLGARVTRRALGISSVFLQGLRSSGLATMPAPGLERDHGAVEDLGGCLVEYMAKVHALEQVSQELETQLRMHLESKATRSGNWGALRASWASSCQQDASPALLSVSTDSTEHMMNSPVLSGSPLPPLPHLVHLAELLLVLRAQFLATLCDTSGPTQHLRPQSKLSATESRVGTKREIRLLP